MPEHYIYISHKFKYFLSNNIRFLGFIIFIAPNRKSCSNLECLLLFSVHLSILSVFLSPMVYKVRPLFPIVYKIRIVYFYSVIYVFTLFFKIRDSFIGFGSQSTRLYLLLFFFFPKHFPIIYSNKSPSALIH